MLNRMLSISEEEPVYEKFLTFGEDVPLNQEYAREKL
jgi:hypothetical protein